MARNPFEGTTSGRATGSKSSPSDEVGSWTK